MPAYAHRQHLIVAFARGDDIVRVHVNDGQQALLQAVSLLIVRHELVAGDVLTVQHGDEGTALPETSRSSHYS
jgi:hypothetical protein